jgi:4-diphosphocytidyl-2-C-methyl-D-erythritol kinase
MSQALHALAPAKINLGLRVLGRREDGFHNLESVFLPLAFGDDLTLEPASSDSFSCSRKDLEEPGNLVLLARDAFRERLSASVMIARGKNHLEEAHNLSTVAKQSFQIHLKKRLPLGAGLGGGSSDAALCLKLLHRYACEQGCQTLTNDDLLTLALDLGSDVPFFLKSEPAYVTGRGENMATMPSPFPGWIVLVWPDFSISTPWAFAKLSSFLTRQGKYATLLGFHGFEAALQNRENMPGNDFEHVVFPEHPELVEIKKALLEKGAFYAALSGSGSTMFGLFDNDQLARQAKNEFQKRTSHVWVTQVLARGEDPGGES